MKYLPRGRRTVTEKLFKRHYNDKKVYVLSIFLNVHIEKIINQSNYHQYTLNTHAMINSGYRRFTFSMNTTYHTWSHTKDLGDGIVPTNGR